MNNVLYEVSPNFNSSWLIIPAIVLFVLAILCPIFIKRRYEKENIELTMQTKLIFTGVILFAVCIRKFDSVYFKFFADFAADNL